MNQPSFTRIETVEIAGGGTHVYFYYVPGDDSLSVTLMYTQSREFFGIFVEEAEVTLDQAEDLASALRMAVNWGRNRFPFTFEFGDKTPW